MKNLNEYLIYTIGERYQEADKGHDIRHILNVFSFAEKVRSTYFDDKVSKDMLMTAVFYHDLACKDDRENHHIKGAEILLTDSNLTNWFSKDDIEMMADAVRNHRASSGKPETIIAKILYDADRSEISLERILERSYQYYIGKGFTNELEIKENMFNHVSYKYGKYGYAKTVLPESLELLKPSMERTKEVISNERIFRNMIDKVVSECKISVHEKNK